jgi:autotransporter adhesin
VAAGVNGGIALGSNAKVNAGALNSVAIGAGSIADRVPVAGTAGTVSIGTTATGGQRQLVNVADGTQATDAVNKRQLDAAIQDIDVRNPFLAIDSTVAIAADDEAFASGGDAMALGKSARAEAQQGLALGFAANVVGQRGIALGSNSSASGTDSVALGANSIANRGNAVSVGSDSLQRQIINVAAGSAATDAVNKAQLDAVESKIVTFDGKVGDQITNINTTVQAAAKAAPWTSIKSVEGEDGVAVATGEDAIALGKESQARGNDTVAIGNGAIAEGDASVSIGKGNRATGKGAVAIGDPNVASGTGAFAGGDENRAIGDGALALGNLNKAFGKSAIALGDNATAGAVQIDPASGLAIIDPVTGDPIPVNSGNIAIGDAASATNADNIAIGSGAKVNVANAMALGKGATVGAAGANSIALGNGSIANEANVLSVGAVGAERRIVNVAQGVGANDAVNVSQLTQAVQNIVAGVNPFFITSSTSGKATANGADSIALGKDATTNGDNSVALGTGSIANGDNVVSVGAAGAERKITNVKAGLISETSTDAVNGAQLLAEVNRAITQSVNPFVTVNSTGGRSTATGSDAVAIGKDSFATGEKAVALGQGASVDATAQNSVALGAGSVVAANQSNTVSVGAAGSERKIVNVADGLVALGSKEAVNGGQLAAVKTVADNALTVANQALTTIKQVNGDVTKVTDTANTALARTQYLEVNSTGAKPKATGEDAIALGENAIANSKDSLAVGTNANATGVAALAIGSGAKSNGAGAIALGNGASSDGSLSVAIGNGAIAGKSGSVAIGQGVTTTRDNQIAVGNSTTTVTMAGLGSAASAAAQTGTTKFVTGDSLGNLAYSTFSTADIANLQKSVADLTGQFSTISTQIEGLGRRAREADGGIAAAMALGGTMLLPDTSVSVSFNLATYRGEQGFSGAVVAKVRENVWVSGGIGGSTVKRSTGGRVGISFGW